MQSKHMFNLSVIILFSILAIGSGTTDPNRMQANQYAHMVRTGAAAPYYIIKPGDSLLKVSNIAGLDLPTLYKYNGWNWPGQMVKAQVGQKVWLVDQQTASAYEIAQAMKRSQQPTTADQTAKDAETCSNYGFKRGTNQFADCMMRIDLARREMLQQQAYYAQQMMQYQQQVAAREAEQKRRQSAYMTELGIRMMGGQAPLDAAVSVGTGAPITQPQMPSTTRLYTLPNGRSMTCTSSGNIVNCF